MNFISWLVLGALTGYGASRLSNVAGPTYLADVLVGMVGAVVGGVACVKLAGHSPQQFDVTSLVAALCGALIALRGLHVWVPRKLVPTVKPSKRWH